MAYQGYNSGYSPSAGFDGTPSALRTVTVPVESRTVTVPVESRVAVVKR